jgi:hypothetical protein
VLLLLLTAKADAARCGKSQTRSARRNLNINILTGVWAREDKLRGKVQRGGVSERGQREEKQETERWRIRIKHARMHKQTNKQTNKNK